MKLLIPFNISGSRLCVIGRTSNSITNFTVNLNLLRRSRCRYVSSSAQSASEQCMRAVTLRSFGGPENLEHGNTAIPRIHKGQVLIRVEAAGINPVDTYVRAGVYKVLPQLPVILGKEVAGIIEKINEHAVSKYNLKVGDRVFARLPENGGYAEFALTSIENVAPLPDQISFSQGACLYVTYYTAYRALVLKSRIKSNDTLFIHGASGGVGTAVLQIAKHLGIKKIGATAGTEEGMKLLRGLGADYVFNHREEGHIYEAKTAMGNTGFDVIIENCAELHLGDDCNTLGPGGRIAVVGCRDSTSISPRSLMITEGEIFGVNLSHCTQEELDECTEFVLQGMRNGWLKPVVGHEYKLEDAVQAHHDMIYKKASLGKLVFKISNK